MLSAGMMQRRPRRQESRNDGFSAAVVRRLRALGYRLDFVSLPGELRMGYGAAVTVGRSSVTAGADPRRAGAAGAVP